MLLNATQWLKSIFIWWKQNLNFSQWKAHEHKSTETELVISSLQENTLKLYLKAEKHSFVAFQSAPLSDATKVSDIYKPFSWPEDYLYCIVLGL